MVLYYICVWYCMEMLCILWYCIVLHVIAFYRMVLHGIVLYLTVLHGIALLASVPKTRLLVETYLLKEFEMYLSCDKTKGHPLSTTSLREHPVGAILEAILQSISGKSYFGPKLLQLEAYPAYACSPSISLKLYEFILIVRHSSPQTFITP